MTASRFFCGISPWMQSASRPSIIKNALSRSVMPFVLQNAITRSWPSARMICAMTCALSFWPTSMRYCAISGLFSSLACTVISSGSRWYIQLMSMTSREIVAENIPRLRREASLSRMRVTSWIKPMSSMRSASSSTTVLTLSSLTVRRFMWSLRRPGVATTICGCFLSASICLPMGAPPYRHTMRTPGR